MKCGHSCTKLLQANLVDWIDVRFNALWAYVKAVHYPWLLNERHQSLRRIRGIRRVATRIEENTSRQPVHAALANAYWLHFASYPHDMRVFRVSTSDQG